MLKGLWVLKWCNERFVILVFLWEQKVKIFSLIIRHSVKNVPNFFDTKKWLHTQMLSSTRNRLRAQLVYIGMLSKRTEITIIHIPTLLSNFRNEFRKMWFIEIHGFPMSETWTATTNTKQLFLDTKKNSTQTVKISPQLSEVNKCGIKLICSLNFTSKIQESE